MPLNTDVRGSNTPLVYQEKKVQASQYPFISIDTKSSNAVVPRQSVLPAYRCIHHLTHCQRRTFITAPKLHPNSSGRIHPFQRSHQAEKTLLTAKGLCAAFWRVKTHHLVVLLRIPGLRPMVGVLALCLGWCFVPCESLVFHQYCLCRTLVGPDGVATRSLLLTELTSFASHCGSDTSWSEMRAGVYLYIYQLLRKWGNSLNLWLCCERNTHYIISPRLSLGRKSSSPNDTWRKFCISVWR